MNAFERSSLIEARGLQRLMPFLMERAGTRGVVRIVKGELAKYLQERVGDVIYNSSVDGRLISLELKTEQERRPNLFLETFSNKNLHNATNHAGRGGTAGWIITSGATLLCYQFLDTDDLFFANMFRLKQWAFTGLNKAGTAGRIYNWEEKPAKRDGQLNDTWGRCVPIEVIHKEVGLRHCKARQLMLDLGEGNA